MRALMRNKRKNLAVTEMIGTVLLLGIASSTFSVVYYQVATAPTPTPAPIVELSGMIDENQVIVTHRGGEPLDLDTELILNVGGSRKSFKVGDLLDSKSKEDGSWGLSEKLVFPLEYDFDYSVYPDIDINVVDGYSNSLLMTGITKVNPTCDVGIDISVDNLKPKEFEKVEITIAITNEGNINASGILIDYLLPDGLTYYSSKQNSGTYNGSVGIWDVGQIPEGETALLKILAIVDKFPYSDPTQLVFVLDGSGSISSESWHIALEGISRVIGNCNSFPHNGNVELTIIQFGGSKPAFARVEIGPIVVTEHDISNIVEDILNISQIGEKTPTSSAIFLAADTLKASDMFDPDIKQIVFLVTDGNPTHCHNPYSDDYIADAGCSYFNGPKFATIDARDYLIDLLELTPHQDEFNVFSVDPIVNSRMRKDEITHIQWLKDNIVWPEPSYYAPPYIKDSQQGWLRNVTTWGDLEYSINETFKILFSIITINVNIQSTAFTDPKEANDISSIVLTPISADVSK